ncbi:hypothetical protein B0T21DRAFT_358397 [Apiosordaria backusii]|uniref:Uncharacterized protein n=1 Tax=Apiosordaria backusii TaxID=314023 RepID=A0AA40ESP0_9PEZI|nr:hypothetical protein B0T21DRAFT_358397 [Apiosordaria backusii]
MPQLRTCIFFALYFHFFIAFSILAVNHTVGIPNNNQLAPFMVMMVTGLCLVVGWAQLGWARSCRWLRFC